MPVLRSARATSAGGVVHRSVDGRTEVVLVHRRSPRLWALPKGTPDAGETVEETALRETREETGLKVEIEGPLRSIRYFFVRGSTRFHKTVHFFLMRPSASWSVTFTGITRPYLPALITAEVVDWSRGW